MFIDTFERGKQDAMFGLAMQFREPNHEYEAGYLAGRKYRTREKMAELMAISALAIAMGAVFLCWVAQGVVIAV